MNVLSIGEILWDQFPKYRVWGGAPANFAFHASQAGAKASVFTAVGSDESGEELIRAIKASKIDLHAQSVNFSTGTVDVLLNASGVPEYKIHENVAWDNILYNETLVNLYHAADLICVGSLAQRNEVSRETIQRVIADSEKRVLFDLNLRQNFYSKELLDVTMRNSDYIKINEDEEAVLKEYFRCDPTDLLNEYSLDLIICTKGESGSSIISSDGTHELSSDECEVIDTVGAGDAFTAYFIVNYLNGKSIAEAHRIAVKAAAYVCGSKGAIVELPEFINESE